MEGKRKEKVTLDLCSVCWQMPPQHIHTAVFIIGSRSPAASMAAEREWRLGGALLKGTSKIVLASEGRSQQTMRVDQVRVSPLN